MFCDLHTSLDKKRYGISCCVNNVKRIHVTHSICLMTVNTHDSVIYLTNKQQQSCYYSIECLTNIQHAAHT